MPPRLPRLALAAVGLCSRGAFASVPRAMMLQLQHGTADAPAGADASVTGMHILERKGRPSLLPAAKLEEASVATRRMLSWVKAGAHAALANAVPPEAVDAWDSAKDAAGQAATDARTAFLGEREEASPHADGAVSPGASQFTRDSRQMALSARIAAMIAMQQRQNAEERAARPKLEAVAKEPLTFEQQQRQVSFLDSLKAQQQEDDARRQELERQARLEDVMTGVRESTGWAV